MPMRMLIMGPEEQARIYALRSKAAANPISLAEMKRRADAYSQGRRVRGFDEFSISLPVGYNVTYTIEQHPKGPMRHLSVSISDRNFVPNPAAVAWLMEHFSFINPMTRCLVQSEDTAWGGKAYNIIEPLDGNWEPHLIR